MKTSNSNIYRNTVHPLSSDKQLLFEEEQKKRAAKRGAALGNLQQTGVSTAPKQTTVSSISKPKSSSGNSRGGGIIETKQNAFTPTAAAQRTGITSSVYKPQSSTRTGMGGSAAGSRSTQCSHMAAGGYNAGRRQREESNITRLTRNEAWNMLGEEAKGKVNYRVPDSLSSEGRDVFFQLMELPDWGLDNEKKDEKVVELKRTISDVVPEKEVRQATAPVLAQTAKNPLHLFGAIGAKRSEKEEEIAENARAMRNLNDILDEQYPLSNDYVPYVGSVANYRLQDAVREIHGNKDAIIKASEDYSVPAEMIAAVILKERYTQSAPDAVVVALDAMFGRMGSTGLGAIQRDTARDAWEYIDPEVAATLPENDVMLATKLWLDDEFNIRTIAAVLRYKASRIGVDMSKPLSAEEVQSVFSAYNGNEEYGQKTKQYIKDISVLLE